MLTLLSRHAWRWRLIPAFISQWARKRTRQQAEPPPAKTVAPAGVAGAVRFQLRIGLALSLWLAAGSVTAGESIALRLESGAHHAPIRAVAADAAGRFAVTAAEDKTARIWDLTQGTLLHTFRPPSSPGNNGKLFAASMTPDGSIFAVAGWSAENDVYLVNRNDGRMVHRIKGLANIVTSLAFSPDGRMLAVGLWGNHGIRLFAATDGWRKVQELAGDADYAGEVNSLAWSASARRLFVSAADGTLRNYDVQPAGLRPAARATLTDIGTPRDLALSRDGSRLAVGSASHAIVAVLDPDTLRTKILLQPPAVHSGRAFNAVAWSADGERLWAGGSWTDEQGKFSACSWHVARPATATCKGIASDTITGLVSLPANRLLHVSATPAVGVVDAAGQSIFQIGGNILDFRQGRSRFRLARDGSGLSFPDRPEGGEWAFDIRQAAWIAPAKDWAAPKTLAGKTGIENWFERQSPSINGKTLLLETNELSLSAAVSADGERVVIGSSQKIRCYGRSGQLQWQTPVPATPWQVNLSRDGQWVVVGFSDGTIRWYSTMQGQEQLAFLPYRDHRRWILWTPSGHFATSPGGESLLGWQVDRGADHEADFYPVAKFRDQYYRPDRIAAIFDSGKIGPTPTATGQRPEPATIESRLPPVVRILAPDNLSQQASEQLKLRVLIESPPDAPVTELTARVNGLLVKLPPLAQLKPQQSQQSGELTVELAVSVPPGEVQLMLFAHNRHGSSSEAALHITRLQAPAQPAATETADFRPTLYVLAIGISAYRDPSIQLEFAAKDSADLSRFLRKQEGGIYRKVVVRQLADATATRDGVLDGLEWIRRELTARDVAIIFLAGHGVNDADGTYYFLPQDVDIKHLKRSSVIFTEIRNTLVSLAGKVLFFIDTCHSGNVLGTGSRSIRNDTTAVVNELSSSDNGVIVFAASTGRQTALESTDWGNGAFTKAILEGLNGQADYSKSGRITHKMLDLYVSERVKRLTDGAQSPVTIVPSGVPDFPLVLGRRGDSL